MKKTLLFSSLAAGLVLTGCNKSTRTETAATDTTRSDAAAATTPAPASSTAAATSTEPTVGQRVDNAAREAGDKLQRAGDRAADAMSNVAHDISVRLTEWKLSAQDIESDIAAERDIVRTKEAAANMTPTGKIDKDTLESAVEGRIKADSEFANLKLDVDGKANGEILLGGKALTADQVGRAIALALDTDGVTKVTSKIRLDKDAVKN